MGMLKISICDDDAIERKKILDNLKVYMAQHPELYIESNVFASAFDILESFEKTGGSDILLLDICMPGMLGTELAHEIINYSPNVDIIFLTTSSDYAVDAFSLHVADYIQKPFTQERFNNSLDRVIASRKSKTWVLISSEGKIHRIALEDILYVETRDKRRVFFLSSGERLTTWLSFDEIKESLLWNSSFVACGASYIVNLSHVSNFEGTNLVIEDGSIIPVPRRLRSQLKEEFFSYYINEAKR